MRRGPRRFESRGEWRPDSWQELIRRPMQCPISSRGEVIIQTRAKAWAELRDEARNELRVEERRDKSRGEGRDEARSESRAEASAKTKVEERVWSTGGEG